MISDTTFLGLVDKVGLAYSRLATNIGNADSPASGTVAEALEDLRDLVRATDDDEFETDIQGYRQGSGGMRAATAQARSLTDCSRLVRESLGLWIINFENYFARFGTAGASSNLDEFCTANNATGAVVDFTCLMPPEFAWVYYYAFSGSPTVFDAAKWPTPTNVFSPVLAAMGSKAVGGAFAAGSAVDATHYAAVQPIGKLTVSTNGTCAITVTGKNQNGTAARTWTGAANTVTAPADVTLTPTVGTDRLTEVTGITFAGSATAGTLHIESILERVIA